MYDDSPHQDLAHGISPASVAGLDGESIQLVVPGDPMPAALHVAKDQSRL